MTDATDANSSPARDRSGMPRWLKAIIFVIVVAIVIVVLFTTVFPWVEERMQDPTMSAPFTFIAALIQRS